jgi:hypothetical protein
MRRLSNYSGFTYFLSVGFVLSCPSWPVDDPELVPALLPVRSVLLVELVSAFRERVLV